MSQSKFPEQPVVILGNGAIACLWASFLRQQGLTVQLLGREQRPAGPVSLDYQAVYGKSRQVLQFTASYARSTDYASTGQGIDTLLLATKSQDAVSAVNAIQHQLQPGCELLTLCNGFGYQDTLVEILESKPGSTLWAGVSSDGALQESTFSVLHTGRGETAIGRYSSPATTSLSELPRFLQRLPDQSPLLNVVNCVDLRQRILLKFFINCAINPLTAWHRCTNGTLLSDPAIQREFKQLCTELQAVCNALPETSALSLDIYAASAAVANTTASNRSSMLRDRELGRKLELQYLNQQLLQLARPHGIELPFNRQLVDLLS